MSEADKVDHYLAGLGPHVRLKMEEKNPATLTEAMEKAINFEVTHFPNVSEPRQYKKDKKHHKKIHHREDSSYSLDRQWSSPFSSSDKLRMKILRWKMLR
jgi:hypothetical protein